jgi:hypothetical protein
MSPFDDGNFVGYHAARARVEARTHARRAVSGRSAYVGASEGACVFRSSQAQSHDDDRPFGLLLPPGPLSMLGSRGSHRLPRSGCIGNVAAPKDWSLARVGSIALLPSSDEDMKRRLALLARIVPDLHEVLAMMPDTLRSINGADVDLQLIFPENVKRASIGTSHPTCVGNVNVSGSSVIGGPGIEEFMILAPSMILASVACLAIPNARSLFMSCDVRSFDGIGRLTSLVHARRRL